MHNFIEYFSDNVPLWVVVALMIVFGVMQGIGEFLEFKGKIVPEFMKIRKRFSRRKKEKEALSQMTDLMPSLRMVPETLEKTAELLQNVDKHYSCDNIAMRDKWMNGVDSNIDEIHQTMKEVIAKLDKNSEDTLAIRIENMRSTIIDFASYVSDGDRPVTKEQFARVFKMYKEYEQIITVNGLTNGEVDIAIHIVREAYEKHLKEHSFLEDSWS